MINPNKKNNSKKKFKNNRTGEEISTLPARLVEFNLHSGVEAQDYSAIAKKEHLKPLELELRRIEDTVEMIQKDFEYMRDREAKMRDTNGLFCL